MDNFADKNQQSFRATKDLMAEKEESSSSVELSLGALENLIDDDDGNGNEDSNSAIDINQIGSLLSSLSVSESNSKEKSAL